MSIQGDLEAALTCARKSVEIAEAKGLPIEVLRDQMGWRDVPR